MHNDLNTSVILESYFHRIQITIPENASNQE